MFSFQSGTLQFFPFVFDRHDFGRLEFQPALGDGVICHSKKIDVLHFLLTCLGMWCVLDYAKWPLLFINNAKHNIISIIHSCLTKIPSSFIFDQFSLFLASAS